METKRVKTPTRGRFAPLAQVPPPSFAFSLSFSFSFTFSLYFTQHPQICPTSANVLNIRLSEQSAQQVHTLNQAPYYFSF